MDFLSGFSVSENSGSVGHRSVAFGVHQKLVARAEDFLDIGSDETKRAGLDAFGSLGFAAQDEDGLAEGGGFFLDPTGVGDHKIGLVQGGEEFLVVQRLAKRDAVLLGKNGLDQLADSGVRVHGKKKVGLGMRVGEVLDGESDGSHGESDVFAAMASDEDEFSLPIQNAGTNFAVAKVPRHPMQGVHDGIAGDINRGVVDVLASKQIRGVGGRSEVPLRDAGEEGAI